MVDSISGAGAPQNLSQVKTNQAQRGESRNSAAAPTSEGDQVNLSTAAQDLADIDALTAQVRSSLEGSSESLSGGRSLDILL
jgi:hypothetical protein